MIGECLAEKKAFGVVRAKEEGAADIGCTAEILEVTKKYPDGRMDILTAGRRRFEVMEVNQERSFLQAEVLFLEDEPALASESEVEAAVALHGELMSLAGAEPQGQSEIKPTLLSFHLVGSLPLDLDFKQNLLAMKSEAERIPAVVSYLQAILPILRRTAHARKTAGGNGRVH
jgi:Lon protease-like protein